MKKILYVSLVLLALSFATATGYAKGSVLTTTGVELHAQSSNAP